MECKADTTKHEHGKKRKLDDEFHTREQPGLFKKLDTFDRKAKKEHCKSPISKLCDYSDS